MTRVGSVMSVCIINPFALTENQIGARFNCVFKPLKKNKMGSNAH